MLRTIIQSSMAAIWLGRATRGALAATNEASHVDAVALAEFPAERPADPVTFAGHHYKVFETAVCWHTAQAACKRMHGHLACVETQAEQEFIAQLAGGRYLRLGASDEAQEGAWKWVNGSPWKFAAWMPGQPNNYGGQENFLATYDGGQWVDVADEGSGFWMPTGFICEWDE